MKATKTEAERFWPKVDKDGPDGCWVWTASVAKKGGYGKFGLTGYASPIVAAHRWAYEALVGPIPNGMVLDHLCHNADDSCRGGNSCPHRRCVNPAHLEPTTHRTNIRRGHSPSMRAHRSDTCKRGHAKAEYGCRRADGSWAGCRECQKINWEAWYAANGAAYLERRRLQKALR